MWMCDKTPRGSVESWVSRFRPQASEARASAPDKAEPLSAATSAGPRKVDPVYSVPPLITPRVSKQQYGPRCCNI
jgi:hypothetical protein